MSRPSPIANAASRRRGIDASAYRLFHGDGEGVPGLSVDRFGDVAVVRTRALPLLERWLPMLKTDLAPYTAYAKVHERAGHGHSELLWGTPHPTVEVLEHGARYEARPSEGLSVGLFLDMREVRQWLRAQAEGRSVLNLFAYTCAFGVMASLGGASRVLNLDLSRVYLEWGIRNYRLNDLRVDSRDFVYGDALDWLQRFSRRGERYDMVIIDPPSFSSTPFSISRDYPRLVELAARVVSPAGILLAAANHAGTSDGRFDSWLRAGLAAASRSARLVERWHEPDVDFPVGPGRRPYLKVRALVLD